MTLLDFNEIVQATHVSYPFPYSYSDHSFTNASIANHLSSTFPYTSVNVIRSNRFDKQYFLAGRTLMRDKQPIVPNLPSAWRTLLAEPSSSKYRSVLSSHYDIDLFRYELEITLWSSPPGGFLSPHVDNEQKVLTHFIFLNPVWIPEWGGYFLVLRSNRWMDVETSLCPALGRGVLLPRTESSWHAIERIAPDAPSRRSLQIVFVQKYVRYSSSLVPEGNVNG